jgi:hypothetical protein
MRAIIVPLFLVLLSALLWMRRLSAEWSAADGLETRALALVA